jgi:hypothetical protein
LFNIGDDIEIVLIGGKKVFEGGILQTKDLVEILFGSFGFRGQPFSKYVYYFQHDGEIKESFLKPLLPEHSRRVKPGNQTGFRSWAPPFFPWTF